MKNRTFFTCVLLSCVIGLCGCSFSPTGKPRPRVGSFAAATMSVTFKDADDIGRHNYSSSIGENKDIVYTCNGGHIDLAHLRIASDHVYYLYNMTRKGLAKGKNVYHFGLQYDPTKYRSKIEFPANFDSMPTEQRQKLIDDVSLELALFYTWYLTSWHEINTWYGYGSFVPGTEFHSAFAWEDIYSNLLGAKLGVEAIETAHGSGTGPYNSAMTKVLEDKLANLGPVPAKEARKATKTMAGKWYSGHGGFKMLLRNVDVGQGDNCVSPAIVPNACPSPSPVCQPVPSLAKTRGAGFKVDFEITSTQKKGRILSFIYGEGEKGPIIPEKHLFTVTNQISREAKEKGYLVME